jgi:hypothetical protein
MKVEFFFFFGGLVSHKFMDDHRHVRTKLDASVR